MNHTTTETRCLKYDLEVEIEAPREVVWQSLTEEINEWWLPDFHVVGPDSVVSLEARAGGALIERKDDGTGLLWSTVVGVTPEQSIQFVGHMFPEWGGPSTSCLHFKLEERGTGTVVKISDSIFGHVSDENLKSLEEGWGMLIGGGLKKYAEERRSR